MISNNKCVWNTQLVNYKFISGGYQLNMNQILASFHQGQLSWVNRRMDENST